MNQKNNPIFAVGVGSRFCIVEWNAIRDIKLKNTNLIVRANSQYFPLYKGDNFEESQKIDKLFDSGKYHEYDIEKCRYGNKNSFQITVTKHGTVTVNAANEEEAIEAVKHISEDDINWNEELIPTNVYENGDM